MSFLFLKKINSILGLGHVVPGKGVMESCIMVKISNAFFIYSLCNTVAALVKLGLEWSERRF